MDDVRGDLLRPPHGPTPAAVIGNKNETEINEKGNESCVWCLISSFC